MLQRMAAASSITPPHSRACSDMESAVQSSVRPRSAVPSLSADETALSVRQAATLTADLNRRLRSVVVGGLSILLWLGLWQLASPQKWNFVFRFENVPAPTDVAAAFSELYRAPKFAAHVGNSLRRIFLGFTV